MLAIRHDGVGGLQAYGLLQADIVAVTGHFAMQMLLVLQVGTGFHVRPRSVVKTGLHQAVQGVLLDGKACDKVVVACLCATLLVDGVGRVGCVASRHAQGVVVVGVFRGLLSQFR